MISPDGVINVQPCHRRFISSGTQICVFLWMEGRIMTLSGCLFNLAPQKLKVLLAQILCLQ